MDEWLAQRPRVGKYEPFLKLAAGGMGAVYLARQIGAAGFERLVVVKRVHPHLLNESSFLDMVRDEARISSLIRHPHVVPVIDVVDVNRELFLVLEYVESIALSALIKARRAEGTPLPIPVVARILHDMLAGLHAAHEAKDLAGNPLGVVHRDVSPHNVLIGSDGVARLIDFGIAKAESRLTVTKSGSLKGKIRYMAPEQIRQQPVDRRADLFSTGVVLFEALTGQHLFAGTDEGAILLRVLMGEVTLPSTVVDGVPTALDEVVTRATTTDLSVRYRTAAEFQEALEAAVPLAPVREVRALVDKLAHQAFAARREAIEAWFQAPRVDVEPVEEPKTTQWKAAPLPKPLTEPKDEGGTRAAVSLVIAVDDEPAAPPRTRRVWVPILGLTLAAGAAAATLYTLRSKESPAPAASAQASASASATSASTAAIVASAPPPATATPTAIATPSAAPLPTKSTAPTVNGKKPKHAPTAVGAPELHKSPYEAN